MRKKKMENSIEAVKDSNFSYEKDNYYLFLINY